MEERRTIDELIALYSLEDTVKDIFVEGERDKTFIGWVIESNKLSNTGIYSINDIHVDNEIIDKYGLPHGSNRARIIAVALEVIENLPYLNNALFIVDRDFSDYLPDHIQIPTLQYTDYNSIELYALNEDTAFKILSVVYGCRFERTPDFYFQIKQALREIYSIRLANEKLKWCMEWIDFKRYIKLTPEVEFDTEKFVEAYLKKNSKWGIRDQFNQQLNLCRKELREDCRLSVRGHDFTLLLQYFLNKRFNKKKIDSLELFEGFLLSTLEREQLLNEAMFKKLCNFVRL